MTGYKTAEKEEYYLRSGKGSTFVRDSRAEEQISEYQIEMLRKNRLAGLLPVQICAINEQREYHYEAEGLISLEEYLDRRMISSALLQAYIESMKGVLDILEEYLLEPDCLCMEPEHIYTDEKGEALQFCYRPPGGETFERGLQRLLQFFLGKLDYSDRQGVMEAYQLYQNAVKEGYRAALSVNAAAQEREREEIPEQEETVVFPWEEEAREEGSLNRAREPYHVKLPAFRLPPQSLVYAAGILLCGVAAGFCYWQKSLLLCGAALLVTAAVFYLLIQYGRRDKGIDSSQNTW